MVSGEGVMNACVSAGSNQVGASRDMDTQDQLASGTGGENRSRTYRHRAQSDNREYVSTPQPKYR